MSGKRDPIGENNGIVISGGRVDAGAMAAGENAVAYSVTGGAEGPDRPVGGPGGPGGVPGRPDGAAAVHRTIMVVDVAGFSDPGRTDAHQLAVREGLYRVLRRAFDAAGLAWDDCYTEDSGDGVLLLAPPEAPKSRFVESLPQALAAGLREHNAVHDARARIRLRMALHAGEVRHDRQGVAGQAVIRACRLVDAGVLRSALAASPGVLVLIVSHPFFDEVVRHSAAADPGAYRQVEVSVKETRATAWIREAGG
ncbi:hypothetical protein [Streptomyces sp. 6N223]|uniref:hypothetical protein n=1 Tax=Streptomyces sp. 6N223 TaxID=3457412 RepID=UPI003FD3853D